MIIKEVKARKIKTSNGRDTIEVVINKKYIASAPLGTSTGKNEVATFNKQGVDFCVRKINAMKDFIGLKIDKFDDLKQIESNAGMLGGNSVIAIEYAILKAMSDNEIYSLLNAHVDKMPMPLGNVIGGGAHFKGNAADFQEFLLMPKSNKFSDNAFANEYVYRQVGQSYPIAKKTIEGAYALNLNNIRIIEILKKIIERASKELGFEIGIGIDIAASSFFRNSRYNYSNQSYSAQDKSLNKKEQIAFINEIVEKYGIEYVEDPMQEEDFNGFKGIKANLVCGDDLICTSTKRLQKAFGRINAVIIKPNQIGSLIKTKEIIELAKENGITPVLSHRSGETLDASISHLAVGWETPYIKTGIFGRERTAKINELIRIEKMLG